MQKIANILKTCLLFLLATPLFSQETPLAKANGIDIWYETFGKKEDPALLLIMGGCCQGVMWPVELCEQFVKAGFYVIRYDHRDTGLSTCIDFEKEPYDFLDMAKDAVGLLDFLKIPRAHLLGLSMGGPIAELMAVHFPERVQTITLMSTTPDFRPVNLALAGLPPEKGLLSGPSKGYLQAIEAIVKSPPKTMEEKLQQRIDTWCLLNGSVTPLEEKSLRAIHQQFLSRFRYEQGLTNHFLAMKRSETLTREVPSQVKVPTLIFHGSEDPTFGPDHGAALAKAIPHARYILIKGMGHVPNSHFFDFMVQEITKLK